MMGTATPNRRVGKRERLGSVLGAPLVAAWLRPLFRTPGVLCITHHRIADRVEHDPDVISATPAQLVQQADWVSGRFRTVCGEDIARTLTGDLVLRERTVAFTFDDAYRDNYDAGRMLMERFGIRATFFVPTGFIESGIIPPWDRLGYAAQHARRAMLHVPLVDGHGPWTIPLENYATAISELMGIYSRLPAAFQTPFVEACEVAAGAAAAEAAPSPFMTWKQIRELRDMGHTIGAHTHTHPVLAALSRASQIEEVRTSREILESQLRQRIRVFAYPYGKPGRSFSETTKAVVAECGFDAAFSFYGGWNRLGRTDPMDVRRIKVDPGTSLSMFRARVVTRGLAPV